MKWIILLSTILMFCSCKISYKEAVTAGAGNSSINGIYFNAKVCLEGAYDGGSSLLKPTYSNSLSYILPLTTPFTPSLNDKTITNNSNDWVDWVKVELYVKNGTSYSLIDYQSALLDKNGDIYSTSETPGLYFPYLAAGEYYVNIITRNHLSVGAFHPVNLSDSLNLFYDIDFTSPATEYLLETGAPTDPFVLKGAGTVKCLAAGDLAPPYYEIDIDDRNEVHALLDSVLINFNDDVILQGYHKEDIDFSGGVQEYSDNPGTSEAGTDSELITANLGKKSQVYSP